MEGMLHIPGEIQPEDVKRSLSIAAIIDLHSEMKDCGLFQELRHFEANSTQLAARFTRRRMRRLQTLLRISPTS